MPPSLYIPVDVRAVHDLHRPMFLANWWEEPVGGLLKRHAESLWAAYRAGNPLSAIEIRNHAPVFAQSGAGHILEAELSRGQIEDVVARNWGYRDGADAEEDAAVMPNAVFEDAVETLLAGNERRLAELLEQVPELATARSPFGHRFTLLHYAGSNGCELIRQIVPHNLPALIRILREAGANPEATVAVYGAEYRPAELLATSAHPRDAGVMEEALAALRSA
ncbi:MAG: hypothetical protein RLY93_13945 [Sumerlaeia bacterium]